VCPITSSIPLPHQFPINSATNPIQSMIHRRLYVCFSGFHAHLTARPQEGDDLATLIHTLASDIEVSETNGHARDDGAEASQHKLESASDGSAQPLVKFEVCTTDFKSHKASPRTEVSHWRPREPKEHKALHAG
jgi:hypothetical protein